MKKKYIILTLGLLVVAFLYSWNQDTISKIMSLIFITIGTEFIPVYYEGKKKMYNYLEHFNENYYDMYTSYITMYIKLIVLSFSVLFSCSYEILSHIFTYPCKIGNYLVPFVFSALIVFIMEIFIVYIFNKTKYNEVFNKILKKRKNDFESEFTDEEKKIMQEKLTQ